VAAGRLSVRVALIVPGFSADASDWCIPSLLHLVRALAREHEVEVLTLRYPAPARRYAVDGVAVRALGGGQSVGAGRVVLLLRALAVLARMRGRRPDVVHGLWADEPGFLAVLGGRLLRRPSVVSLLGGELTALPEAGYGHQLHRVPRFLVACALARAGHVTAGSLALAAAAGQRVEAARLSVLPWGVDTTLFSPAGPGREIADLDGEPVLLNVASLSPVKDQALLLQALAALRALAAQRRELPRARLHLVGAGPERAALERLAGALQLSDRVRFHGEVRHERLPGYYRAADLFLLSSRHESQCMAVLEAAACGTPTVGMAVGVVPELAHARAARALTDRDPARFAAAIRALAAAPAERGAMRQAGLDLVEERFALAVTARRLGDLYGALARPTANSE
jgi:glycosyltransferase involved in cell wall biosynthesis